MNITVCRVLTSISSFYRTGRRPLNSSRLLSQDAMNIFDRKSKLMQRERSYALPDISVYDYLKDEVGSRLADRVFDISRKFDKVIDLGCGRGHVSKHVEAECVQNLYMYDSCAAALEQSSLPEEGVKVTKVLSDEECFTFEENSVDLVISSLSLHWVNDLPETFKRVKKCLKNDGAFLGAVFGADTLYELRSSLQLAETERAGGISAHISPFTDVTDIGALLNQAGFTLLTIDTDEIVVGYPSMFELMHDLKGMGESNCTWQRCRHLRRDVLLSAAAIYQQLYGTADTVPATFHVIYFVGWKPDPSQPRPAPRGSASHSLKELNNVTPKK